MSETTLYDLGELARELGLPEYTILHYRDAFAPHVPSIGVGRKRRYPVEALTVLRFIADALVGGRTRHEIMQALADGAGPQPTHSDAAESTPAFFQQGPKPDRDMTSLIEGEREQRELMWQMIRELSRFGDAIERQHYVLSELVEHIFHKADPQLLATPNGNEMETVVEADVVVETEDDNPDPAGGESPTSQDDEEALRKALETERDLVSRLRQSKLELERRAAAAETKLEQEHEQEPGLLRRLFGRHRGH